MDSKIIFALFIAFIMITSVIGFIWSSDSSENNFEVLEYKGHQFKNINGKYLLELNGNEYVFDNSPYGLNGFDFEQFSLESNKYYILFNPVEKDLNMEYSMQKLYLVLRSLNINVQLACSKEEGCDNNLPVKSCEEYSFYMNKGDNIKVHKDNKCVVIQGDNQGISRAVDKINLMLLKV